MSAEKFRSDFQTPPEVCKYMASLVPKTAKRVLEPTSGIGNIKKELCKAGFDVEAPEDYFLLDKSLRFDAVVMNPPFSHKFTLLDNAPADIHKLGMRMGYWFLTECLNRSDNVIALMPWFTISDSDVRLRSLYRYGMKSVTALPRKTFQFARIQTVVLEMDKGFKGDTIFKAYDCLNDHRKIDLFATEEVPIPSLE